MFFSFPRISGTRRTCTTVVAGVGAMLLFAGLAQAQHDHAKPTAPMASTAPATPPTGATTASAMPNAVGTPAALRFESVLSRYKPMTDQKLGSWREANDTVTRIGGWRAYLKESQAPEAIAPVSPATSPKPVVPTTPITPNPHAGHGAKP